MQLHEFLLSTLHISKALVVSVARITQCQAMTFVFTVNPSNLGDWGSSGGSGVVRVLSGTVYSILAFSRKTEETKLPNTPTSSDAKLRPSLSLRPQFGAGCG